HHRGLVLLKHRLLIRLSRGIVVQRQLQFGAVWLLRRGYSQPAIWALAEIILLGKAEHIRIEAQSFFLVVHKQGRYFDLHFVSPLSRSRFEPRSLLMVFFFRTWMQAVEVAFKGIHVGRPEAAIFLEPGCSVLERTSVQTAGPPLRLSPARDQSGAF